VTQYGMSDLGPIQYGRGQHQVFLGRDISEERNYSEEVASKIDAEVRKIIEASYETGKRILTDSWDKVERMVGSLLEHETVEAEEVKAILDGRPFRAVDKVPPQTQPPTGRPDEPQRIDKPKLFPPKISPEPA
jgi:cell division protease FtsH